MTVGEVERAQRLVAVLAAADVEEVVRRRGRSSSPRPRAGQLEADPAPGAAALAAQSGCRGRRRCSSGRDRARRRAASRSATAAAPPRSRRARASAAMRARRLGREAGGAALGLERRDVERARARSRRSSAVRAPSGPNVRRMRSIARAAGPARTAIGWRREAPAVDARRRPAAAARWRRRRRPRARRRCAIASRPPGREVARARRRGTPRALGAAAGSSASARATSAKRARRARSRARRRRRSSTSSPRAAARSASAASSAGSRSSAVTSWPARGEVERDAPGAGADVEQRPAVRRAASSRHSGRSARVAAALDVVPDDAGRRQRRGAHRQCPGAAPRRASRSRSSSSAV